ncbi:pilus assembly protein [Aquitalea sp. FJL05]|nr:pilus assembly protein [Aquitalea sp. FJL05]
MRLIILIITLLAAGLAQAGPVISIGALYNYIDHDRSSILKRIYNSGSNTAFVRITIHEVVYDSNGKHRELPVTRAEDGARLEGLIASPSHVIVPASSASSVRLLHVGSRERESYYRVRFVPVLPQKKDEFGLDDKAANQYQNSLDAGVNVLTGYGAFLIVRPHVEHYDTVLDSKDDAFVVSNRGNSTIVLEALYQCEAGNVCTDAVKRHVLPQASLRLERTPQRRYHFELIEGTRSKPVSLP